MGLRRTAHLIGFSVLILLTLAVVPVLHRAVVAGDAAVNLRFPSADGAGELLPGQIAVVCADGIGGRQRIVRQLVVLRDLTDQRRRCPPIGQLFAQEGVEHRAAGIEGLELVLYVQGGEHVLRVAHRQVAGIGVVGRPALVGGDDIGVLCLIVLGKAIGGGLGRGGLQIVEVAILLLIIAQPLPHVLQHPNGKVLRLLMGEVLAEPVGVQARLIHADETDGGKVIVEAAEIAFGVGVQPLLHQPPDGSALDLQTAGSNVHHVIQPGEEIRFILGKIGNTGQIDGHNPHGAGRLAAAEEAAALFPQFPEVQAQAAAHAAHVAGLHVGVDVVGEIRHAVFGGHLKEQPVVLRLGPVEVLGDGIGRDGILEAAAVGVAFDHDLDECLVDHVHLRLAVAIGKVHGLAAYDTRLTGQIGGYGPVQSDV